ncbi:head-tail connector protein [Mesorhizobium sp. A623]
MIEITTPPVVPEAFTDLVLDHCKVEAGDEETAYGDLIAAYIEAAIGKVESASGRLLFKRTMTFTADAFGTALAIPASPVLSVASVAYIDPAGASQTLDSGAYVLVDRLEDPALFAAYGTTWPEVRAFPGVVTVIFDAGYGDAADSVPAELRMAVMQTVADWMRFGGNVATTSLSPLPADARRACMNFRRTWA